MTYRVTAQTKSLSNGLRGVFEKDIATASNAKEARQFFKDVYQPMLEAQHGQIKILGVSKTQ